MNVRLSVAVMAHPAREQEAERLGRTVGARVTWDRHRDEWETGSRALAAYDPFATHHIVLQDDAVPVDDFRCHAAAAIAQHPDSLISFYLGRSRPPHMQRRFIRATLTADETGAAWLSDDRLHHGVGIALPVADIDPLLEWARIPNLPYDERIGTWYRAQRRRVMYTWPSLVDHADTDTLVTHHDGAERPPGRVAWRTGTPSRWDTHVIPI